MVLVASGPRRVSHETPRKDGTNVGDAERLASALGGAAMAIYGLRRGGVAGGLLAAAGVALAGRGATGICPVYRAVGMDTAGTGARRGSPIASLLASRSVKVQRRVVIARPREELFAYWRDFENLPSFMRHLERVHVLGRGRSHWEARGPLGQRVEWDAVVHREVPNELIAWRSVAPADVPNAGTVLFRDLGDGLTEVAVELEYEPPAGVVGFAVARLLGEEPDVQVRDDLDQFKAIMEGGDISGGAPD
jgi:uncharacterized membrane protein